MIGGTKLGAALPESLREREPMDFTVDLHLDLGPALVEELVPVGESELIPYPRPPLFHALACIEPSFTTTRWQSPD